jgi:signal transduction histidine kinase
MEKAVMQGLAQHPFFAVWPEDVAADLCKASQKTSLGKDAVIYDIGDRNPGIHLILDGEIVFYGNIGGILHEVDRRTAGDAFGEVSLITGSAHRVRAVAGGASTVAFIPAQALEERLGRIPPPLQGLLNALVLHVSKISAARAENALQIEKMAMVGTMVNNIVHDFKSPFQMISLGAETIGSLSHDRQVQRLCSNITEQVSRMLKMAAELAEFSHGHTAFKFERVNLRPMMEQLRESYSMMPGNKEIELVTDAPDAEVDIEPRAMMRVFQNLISNAIDALGNHGGRIEIRIPPPTGDRLTITVSDNGRGIPEHIRQIFWEPFVTSGKKNGTGLGTAIVKSIIEGHAGTIDFATETGKGTTFTIQMPRFHGIKAGSMSA